MSPSLPPTTENGKSIVNDSENECICGTVHGPFFHIGCADGTQYFIEKPTDDDTHEKIDMDVLGKYKGEDSVTVLFE